MKQVNPLSYNKEYYLNEYGESNYSSEGGYFKSSKDTIYSEMANFVDLGPEDKIVDYGCGNGNLSFYLVSRYNCSCVGIDYSKDAIDICNNKLKAVPLYFDKIKFINSNNNQKYNFDNIKVVYLCDVVEHMYDQEIEVVLNQMKHWNKEDKIKIVIHIDNNIYLMLIKPVFDLVNILLGNSSIKETIRRNRYVKKRHINLTNPYWFKKKMKKFGFKEVYFRYPTQNMEERIRTQLGSLQKIPFLAELSFFVLKRLSFLNPSFYAIYVKM